MGEEAGGERVEDQKESRVESELELEPRSTAFVLYSLGFTRLKTDQ